MGREGGSNVRMVACTVLVGAGLLATHLALAALPAPRDLALRRSDLPLPAQVTPEVITDVRSQQGNTAACGLMIYDLDQPLACYAVLYDRERVPASPYGASVMVQVVQFRSATVARRELILPPCINTATRPWQPVNVGQRARGHSCQPGQYQVVFQRGPYTVSVLANGTTALDPKWPAAYARLMDARIRRALA